MDILKIEWDFVREFVKEIRVFWELEEVKD